MKPYENQMPAGVDSFVEESSKEEVKTPSNVEKEYKNLSGEAVKAHLSGQKLSPEKQTRYDQVKGEMSKLAKVPVDKGGLKQPKLTPAEEGEIAARQENMENFAKKLSTTKMTPGEEGIVTAKRENKKGLVKETLVDKFNDAHLYNDGGKFQLALSNGETKEFNTKNEALDYLSDYSKKDYSWAKDEEQPEVDEDMERAYGPMYDEETGELNPAYRKREEDVSDEELKEELVDNKYYYENARNEEEVAKWLAERQDIPYDRALAFVKANYKGGEIWSEGKPSNNGEYDPSDVEQSTAHHNAIIDKINDRYEKGKINKSQYWKEINEEADRWDEEQYQWWEDNPKRDERFAKKDEYIKKYLGMGYDPATAQLKAEKDVVSEEEVYPNGTSKEYTEKVNDEYEKALPILEKAGIKLEEFGGHSNDRGGYEDNTKEIMDKYVFRPFREKYPSGNNDAWNREYKQLYEAIDAVLDKNYNDWWIKNK